MMTTAADLSTITLAAGEPFLLEAQFQAGDGSVPDASARAFVLSLYQAGSRTPLKTIEGDRIGAVGAHLFRFVREGLFTEQLYAQAGGQPVAIELAERLRNGRDVIAVGRLTIDISAEGVTSLDAAKIGRFIDRIQIRDPQDLGEPTFKLSRRPYEPSGTPAPTWTVRPSIVHDGTPQVDETYSVAVGTIANGTAGGVQWLLDGAAIAGQTAATYKAVQGDVGKALRVRVTATGPGGTSSETSDAIMVAAASVTPTIWFDPATISATEGNTGTKTLTMTLLRSTSAGAIAATATFVQGSAGAADFAGNALPGNKVFTFADGVTSATATVAISGDTDVESDETFGYQLVAPSGYALGSPSSLTGTILNDDTAVTPTVTLSAATSSANEGNAGTPLAWVYTVTLSTSSGAVVVPWTFAAGMTDATDWSGGTLPAGGGVSFAAGETQKTFSVISSGDTTVEGNESFTVAITAPSGYAAGATMSATGTILNDDSAAQPITFDPVATLSGQQYTFTARRSGSTSAAETRSWSLGGSTDYAPAALASDFGGTFPSGTVIFAAGSATAAITVTAPTTVQPE